MKVSVCYFLLMVFIQPTEIVELWKYGNVKCENGFIELRKSHSFASPFQRVGVVGAGCGE